MRAFSAGGVIYRRRSSSSPDAPQPLSVEAPVGDVEIVLVGRASENFWVLPKGTPHEGESTEEVALREVEEETGVKGRVVGELGSIHYWFSRHGTRFNKEVFYFLMEAVDGDVSLHDDEYDDAQWFPLGEAVQRLAYANEAELARAAANLLEKRTDRSLDV